MCQLRLDFCLVKMIEFLDTCRSNFDFQSEQVILVIFVTIVSSKKMVMLLAALRKRAKIITTIF